MALEAPSTMGLNERTAAFNEKVPAEIGFKSFMMFYKRQAQKLCKKKFAVSNTYYDKFLFQWQKAIYLLYSCCRLPPHFRPPAPALSAHLGDHVYGMKC